MKELQAGRLTEALGVKLVDGGKGVIWDTSYSLLNPVRTHSSLFLVRHAYYQDSADEIRTATSRGTRTPVDIETNGNCS